MININIQFLLDSKYYYFIIYIHVLILTQINIINRIIIIKYVIATILRKIIYFKTFSFI